MSANERYTVYYVHPDVREFVKDLDRNARSKYDRLLSLLAQKGPQLGMPFVKKIHPRLYELRILGLHNVRLLYVFRQDEIWLLHGIRKKRDSIPPKDIALALNRLSILET